jgi:hypothetical protein
MKMNALNNILLDLPVQLSTLVRIYTPSCRPYKVSVSHAFVQWHLPSLASHCLGDIAGLHIL